MEVRVDWSGEGVTLRNLAPSTHVSLSGSGPVPGPGLGAGPAMARSC